MIFYIAVTIVSTVTFTVDLILRYMEKIRSFGMEERIHNIKGKLIPVEDFIPYNLTLLALSLMAFGTAGILLKLLDLNGLVAFPVCVMCGMFTNFAAVRLLRKIRTKPLPKNADLSGIEGVCSEKIEGDGYGAVTFTYEGRSYTFPAVSENETDIEKGETAVIILMNEGVCFVEKQSEVLDILNEREG